MATKPFTARKCPFINDELKQANAIYLGMQVGEKAIFDPSLNLDIIQASHLHLQWKGELICNCCDEMAHDIRFEMTKK